MISKIDDFTPNADNNQTGQIYGPKLQLFNSEINHCVLMVEYSNAYLL